MLKKRTILSVASILCVCLLIGGYFVGRSVWEKANAPAFEIRPDVPDAPDRELIDPSEKVLASDEWTILASRLGPPVSIPRLRMQKQTKQCTKNMALV